MTRKYILFDMDDTLIDSEGIYIKGWRQVFLDEGINISHEVLDSFKGIGSDKINEMIASHSDMETALRARADREEWIYKQIQAGSFQFLDGAPELLDYLRDHGYTLALASLSGRKRGEMILDHLDITDRFDSILFEDDVTNPKPDPEIYLKTLDQLGITADQAIVVEDSMAGSQAAINAGIPCLFVNSSLPDRPDVIHFNHLAEVLEWFKLDGVRSL